MKCLTLWMLFTASAAAGQAPQPVTHYDALSAPPLPQAAGENAELAMAPDNFDRMTVAVTLGATRAYDFLVDTGADRTSVSRELARELGLGTRPSARLHTATGSTMVGMVWLPELRMSQRSVRNIAAPTLDAADIGADGILGIDSLRAQRVVFDFGQGRLSILSGSSAPVAVEDAILVRAKRREGRLVITDAKIDGERVSVILDSGSTLTVGNLALRKRLARDPSFAAIGPMDLVSVTGQSLRGELASVAALDIGGARLQGLQIVFADAHTFRELGLSGKPAILLGMNALRGFDQVSIDFAARTVSLVLPKGRRADRS